MSFTEQQFGTIQIITTHDLENKCKHIIESLFGCGQELNSNKTWKEELNNRLYYKYYCSDIAVYEIRSFNLECDYHALSFKTELDDKFVFSVRYHNGGTHFGEMIQDVIKEIESQKV